eukprot:4223453-Pyramimonas_sp.AAC.1
MVSAYLKDSEGLSGFNMGVLCKLGAALSWFPGPFILGCDFQEGPEVLAARDLASAPSANLAVPDSGHLRWHQQRRSSHARLFSRFRWAVPSGQ